MSQGVTTSAEFLTSVVDLSTDSTTVYEYPVILRGVQITASISAHPCPITDGSSTLFSLPASSTVGQWIECGDATMDTLVVDPDNSATGTVTVVYKPV